MHYLHICCCSIISILKKEGSNADLGHDLPYVGTVCNSNASGGMDSFNDPVCIANKVDMFPYPQAILVANYCVTILDLGGQKHSNSNWTVLFGKERRFFCDKGNGVIIV